MTAYLDLIRFNRPVGTLLLLWPCLWGLALGGQPFIVHNILFFTLGAFLMRSAGCVYNDLMDRDIDALVARTKNRPLASGVLTPQQAWGFFGVLILGAFGLLVYGIYSLGYPVELLYWSVGSLGLVGAYPLMKRITYWPQLFLGLTFSWGIFMGVVVTNTPITISVFLLYGCSVLWTLAYDTIYGYQDLEDDLKIGVKSTPMVFGDLGKWGLLGIYTALFGGLLALGILEGAGTSYYLGIFLFSIINAYLVWTLNLKNPQACLRVFKLSSYLGILIWLSL